MPALQRHHCPKNGIKQSRETTVQVVLSERVDEMRSLWAHLNYTRFPQYPEVV